LLTAFVKSGRSLPFDPHQRPGAGQPFGRVARADRRLAELAAVPVFCPATTAQAWSRRCPIALSLRLLSNPPPALP